MRSIGRDPLFMDRGAGAELFDVDENPYIDWVCSWGPLIAGHAQGYVLERLFVALDQRAGIPQEVFLRLAWYGAFYFAGVLAVIRVGRALPEAARTWLSTSVALTVPAVLLVLLSMFNHPGVLQPWRGLALICASAGVTAWMLGVLLANDEDRL